MPQVRPETRPVGPFLWLYAIAFLVLSVLTTAFFMLTGLPTSVGVSLGILVGAATFTGQRFYAEVGRPPQNPEVWKLTIGSFVISKLLTFAILATTALMAPAMMESLFGVFADGTFFEGLVLALAIVGLLALIELPVLWLSYGPLTRWISKTTEKRKNR